MNETLPILWYRKPTGALALGLAHYLTQTAELERGDHSAPWAITSTWVLTRLSYRDLGRIFGKRPAYIAKCIRRIVAKVDRDEDYAQRTWKALMHDAGIYLDRAAERQAAGTLSLQP